MKILKSIFAGSFIYIAIYISMAFFGIVFSQPAIASQEAIIQSKTASLYDSPSGRVVGKIEEGRKVKVTTQKSNGFIKLETKTGRALWIKETDLRSPEEFSAEDDVASGDAPKAHEPKSWYLTYDVGFSSGTSGSTTYSEANVGLNLFMKEWIAWRNALFARFIQPENIYGLDTSIRLFYSIPLGEKSRIELFGGPGWRFVTKGNSDPFAEAGITTILGGFKIGAGVKTFLGNLVRSGATQDTQYFFVFSGGGTL